MLIYTHKQMEELTAAIFEAADAPSDIAAHVARSLVESNLQGHDSHGVLRIPQYLESIEKGALAPAARPLIANETPTTAVVDGNWAFGQITAAYAATVAIEKARSQQVAAVSVLRANHIGRLGEYTDMAAKEGMWAFMAGGTFQGGAVAPHGGAGRVLGTNPMSFSMPGPGDEPIVADMATSVVAEGKLRVARAKGLPVAPGTLIDKDGNPSVDPADYYGGGALLPVGGHKGYALSIATDLIARHAAPGDRATSEDVYFGKFMVVVNLEAFRPLGEFRDAVAARAEEIRGTRLAPGFSEILMPGEPEQRTRAKRLAEGIPMPEDTAQALSTVAAKLGVPMPKPVG